MHRVTKLEELPARLDDLGGQLLQLRTEMRAEFSAVRDGMRASDERVMGQARVLHEDVIARLRCCEKASRRG